MPPFNICTLPVYVGKHRLLTTHADSAHSERYWSSLLCVHRVVPWAGSSWCCRSELGGAPAASPLDIWRWGRGRNNNTHLPPRSETRHRHHDTTHFLIHDGEKIRISSPEIYVRTVARTYHVDIHSVFPAATWPSHDVAFNLSVNSQILKIFIFTSLDVQHAGKQKIWRYISILLENEGLKRGVTPPPKYPTIQQIKYMSYLKFRLFIGCDDDL